MPNGTTRARDRSRFVEWLLFALVFAAGVWLRLDQIAGQIVADDEWHSVNYLAVNGYDSIFLHFGASDHCIPSTLLAKLVADRCGLSEISLRVPAIAAGLLALLVLPFLVRRRFGRATGLVFAALLAISPLHVFFSRYARPYSIVFLLGLAGILAFERWMTSRSRASASAYVACAALAPWFHPAIGPFVLAPIAWFALFGRGARGESLAARLRALLPLAIPTAIALAALLGPPIVADWTAIDEKAGLEDLSLGAIAEAYVLASGAPDRLPGFLFDLGFLAGAFVLWRRERALLGFLGFAVGCELLALGIARPFRLEVGIVLARYTIPALGLVLIVVAHGLVSLDRFVRSRQRLWPRHVLPATACVLLLASGPVAPWFDQANAAYYRPNDWTNHSNFQSDHREHRRRESGDGMLPRGIPLFYQRLLLLRRPEIAAQPILEGPWLTPWPQSPFYLYQRVHRRPTYVGYLRDPGVPIEPALSAPGDPRLRFERVVDLDDHQTIAARGIRFVVLHKRLNAEIGRLGCEDIDAAPVIARYRTRYGEPVYDDEFLSVFDVRRRRPADGG